MYKIEIEHNLDELVADLEKFIQKLQNLSDFWRNYTLPSLFSAVDDIFWDEPWVPLNPIYEAQKSAISGGGILELTGRLRTSLTSMGAPESVQDIRADSLVYGTDVPYAFYHEFGITPPTNWGSLPQRSVLGPLLDAGYGGGPYEDTAAMELESYIDDLVVIFEKG